LAARGHAVGSSADARIRESKLLRRHIGVPAENLPQRAARDDETLPRRRDQIAVRALLLVRRKQAREIAAPVRQHVQRDEPDPDLVRVKLRRRALPGGARSVRPCRGRTSFPRRSERPDPNLSTRRTAPSVSGKAAGPPPPAADARAQRGRCSRAVRPAVTLPARTPWPRDPKARPFGPAPRSSRPEPAATAPRGRPCRATRAAGPARPPRPPPPRRSTLPARPPARPGR